MMIDDYQDDINDESEYNRSQPRLPWYLLDTEKNFCKFWEFLVCWITIYNLIMVPFLLTFPEVYQSKEDGGYRSVTEQHQRLKSIERLIDILFVVEIVFNFVKRTRTHTNLSAIAKNYLYTYFVVDFVATIPLLFFLDEDFDYYFIKVLRIFYVFRLTKPLELLLGVVLQKYSKKRQNDLTSFCSLILFVVYLSHICACIWLYFGTQYPCKKDETQYYVLNDGVEANQLENCIASWVYASEFEQESITTRYIFSLYWIFEVITTVGYGDYSGQTSNEYIFSILLEFIGLTFFSFLMGSITSIVNTSDSFDDLIEEKLDSLDMWIKNIEKSNKPFHIQPSLYNDIRNYVEQAFMFDFNLVIEEFPFY